MASMSNIAEALSELSLGPCKAESKVAGEEEALQALRELIGEACRTIDCVILDARSTCEC